MIKEKEGTKEEQRERPHVSESANISQITQFDLVM